MDALTDSVETLADMIRAIEAESGVATHIIVTNGQKRYLVGDLTERQGPYEVVLEKRYYPGPKEEPVPHQEIAGEYDSLDELREAVSDAGFILIREEPYGCTIDKYVKNGGYTGESSLTTVGKIIYPLLGEDEAVNVRLI